MSAKLHILVKYHTLCGVGGGSKKTVFSLFLPLGVFKLRSELDLVAGGGAPAHFLRKHGDRFTYDR